MLKLFAARITLDPERSLQSRSNEWTIFSWAWWIAFAPSIGLFLARVSRGRTIREFIFGAALMLTMAWMIWFASTGGPALLFELCEEARQTLVDVPHASRINCAMDLLFPPFIAGLLKAIMIQLTLTLVVPSASAAIIGEGEMIPDTACQNLTPVVSESPPGTIMASS
ncbi:MAG: BCCT family transporter [Pseudomonadota bacterium]